MELFKALKLSTGWGGGQQVSEEQLWVTYGEGHCLHGESGMEGNWSCLGRRARVLLGAELLGGQALVCTMGERWQ